MCTRQLSLACVLVFISLWARSEAAPVLMDPAVGTLELVTPNAGQQAMLNLVDGLALDGFGNLFGALEIFGSSGGVVYIDKATGDVTNLVSGLSRADQIALGIGGDLFVTSEVTPASTSDRLFRVTVNYGAGDVPLSASATDISTSLAINNPEGLIVLDASGPFGSAGDLYVAEDRNPGSIFQVNPADGTTTLLTSGLARPEGMAFGSFNGQVTPSLFAAETSDNNVLQIDSAGVATTFGNPAAVSLTSPDNVEFGPDGFLYISEDRSAPNSRILRVKADGTHTVFATGFGQASGMIFDPLTGHLYIAEQDFDRVWRVRFNHIPGDVNGDGKVDAADYTLWANGFGQVGVDLSADLNDNGEVDAADYTVWANNFGMMAGSVGPRPVPEPSSLVLICSCAAVLALAYARRRPRSQ